MLIRQGQRRDAENLSALAMQVWLHTYATEGISSVISRYVLSELNPKKFEALLSKESSAVLVAEKGENLVGYATVTAGTTCPVVTTSKRKSRPEVRSVQVSSHACLLEPAVPASSRRKAR